MTFRIAPELVGIDRLLDRWARLDRPTKQLHPLEALRLMHDGAILKGGPGRLTDDVAALDAVISSAPANRKQLILAIYVARVPMSAVADRIGISRATVYRRWNEALCALKAELETRGVHT